MHFDNIIVGGGTAGAALAARLSEEQEKQVLLLEAGPDYPNAVPPELLDASLAVTAGHNWCMQAIVGDGGRIQAGRQGGGVGKVFELASTFVSPQEKLRRSERASQTPLFPYLLGKVVGGGSAINGCLALHARPEDYRCWTAAGNEAWSWDRVRPYMSRIENADLSKPFLPVEKPSLGELTTCQRAFLDSCNALGAASIDLAQGTVAGVGTIPKNVRRGQRVSTSDLYLSAARSRRNLGIQPDCLVNRLLVETRRGSLTVIGVEALVEGTRRQFFGEHITLAAGAINSPAILLRSGIGAAPELARRNIKPLLDLPGVGNNLQDHPSVVIWGRPRTESCRAGEPVHQVMAQRRSTAAETLCDVQLFMVGGMPTRAVPGLGQMAGSDLALGVSAVLATPRSKGRVEVIDGDATRNPHVHLNCLQDTEDLRRMMEGVRSAWCILRQKPLGLHVDRLLFWTQNIIDSDPLLERLIRTTVRTTWHPVGTLRIGKENDAMAVVDQRGQIYGCRNVTVADASIIPTIPSVPPNLTCILIGERISAMLRGLEA